MMSLTNQYLSEIQSFRNSTNGRSTSRQNGKNCIGGKHYEQAENRLNPFESSEGYGWWQPLAITRLERWNEWQSKHLSDGLSTPLRCWCIHISWNYPQMPSETSRRVPTSQRSEVQDPSRASRNLEEGLGVLSQFCIFAIHKKDKFIPSRRRFNEQDTCPGRVGWLLHIRLYLGLFLWLKTRNHSFCIVTWFTR